MSAWNTVQDMKLSDMLDAFESSGLKAYEGAGIALAQSWRQRIEKRDPNDSGGLLIASLENSDFDGRLMEVLNLHAEQVLDGIRIAARMLDLEKQVLHLPKKHADAEGALAQQAQAQGMAVVYGMVDVREQQGAERLHLMTAKFIAEVFEGVYEPGVYAAINGGEMSRVSGSLRLKELAGSDSFLAIEAGGHFYLPQEAELTLAEAGVADGVLHVMPLSSCPVDYMADKMLLYGRESCGQCVFCREGLIQIEGALRDMTAGKGRLEQIPLMREIAQAMIGGTLCEIGQQGGRLASDMADKFQGQLERHIKKKECDAGVCQAFKHIYIDPHLCTGCGECIDACPVDCIEGKDRHIHMIESFDCTKCGKCIGACPEEAIKETSGKVPKLPDRLTKCGRFKK